MDITGYASLIQILYATLKISPKKFLNKMKLEL